MSKIKVNRNILCAEAFAFELANFGISKACISPGSRNTPLILAFTSNKKINSFSVIDERSSGFFALGLSKYSQNPAVLICTSGTAAAEFYPAIVEAFQSKTPLIICSADRPPSLRNTGANQTINQENIYKNHILWFADAGLPKTSMDYLWHVKNIARKAFIESTIKNRGPVHVNFPFDKPLDPESFTDLVDENQIDLTKRIFIPLSFPNDTKPTINDHQLQLVLKKVSKSHRGIILAGFDNYSKGFPKSCIQLSLKTGFPILADAASNLRLHSNSGNILCCYDTYLRSEIFTNNHQTDFIIQFGRNFTSKALNKFIENSTCERLLVNEFGDWKNSRDHKTSVIAAKPELFCKTLIPLINTKSNKLNNWLKKFITIEKTASQIKDKLFSKAAFPNEVKIVYELIKEIPDNSNLMVSNSLPIRDLDLIAQPIKKKITIYHNRGASGVDGIISTAIGIAKSSKQKTYLLTGDLAFYNDINSLLIADKYSIPLTIVLINNNGGRIFETLPISNSKNIFEEFFTTPHFLNFKYLVQAFGGQYYQVKSWRVFKQLLSSKSTNKTYSVLEIKTDSKKSQALRKKYQQTFIDNYNKNKTN